MTRTSQKPKVAVGVDFLKSFSNLPPKQQKKVGEFTEKFRSNPEATGHNLEKIKGAKDPKLYSVRIDQDYRGLVLKPPNQNLYMLLWVDKHDEAYEWACRRMFDINPHTGSLQVYPVKEKEEIEQGSKSDSEIKGLFDNIKDKDLLRLGVPEHQMSLVRNVINEDDLDRIENEFPQEAAEALFLLAAGFSIEETYQEMEKSKPGEVKVDTENFEKALQNPDSQRRFHFVEEETELAEMLNAPLEQWRVFLHPAQRRLVRMHANGPVRVLGGAGTGKTVVAMHRAKYLIENVFPQKRDQLFFTTFTKNLAEDIKENLKKICSIDDLRRIEVLNIDAWVHNFLKKHNYAYSLLYPEDADEYWDKAIAMAPPDIDYSREFYRKEWDHVIQAQAISRMEDYLRASRVGRGRKLSRIKRKKIWTVFEEYRLLLNRDNRKEFVDAMRDARFLLEQKGDILPYKSIVVDEAQDMNAEAFRLFRQMIPASRSDRSNDIFIVGDSHQRIYENRVVLSHCGIDIRGRGRKLRLNYRTTDEIRRWAVTLLEDREYDDLDNGHDSNTGFKSLMHGQPPEVRKFDSFDEETEFLRDTLETYEREAGDLRNVCLVTRTQRLLKQYEERLSESGFDFTRIKRSRADDSQESELRTATMHRVKGLEFDYIVVAGANEGIIPLEYEIEDQDNEYAAYESENRERSLLYVAATRAKKAATITCHGKPSPFLKTFTNE